MLTEGHAQQEYTQPRRGAKKSNRFNGYAAKLQILPLRPTLS
jgi:hypothetical protein